MTKPPVWCKIVLEYYTRFWGFFIMQAHVLKIKTDKGWVPVPILVGDIYTAYVEYCNKNNIEPVTQETYYKTLGNLESLINELGANTGNITEIVNSLKDGVLPISAGGLGVQIGEGKKYTTIKDALLSLSGAITEADVDEKLDGMVEDLEESIAEALGTKGDAAAFAYGPNTPDSPDANIDETVQFYFQITE